MCISLTQALHFQGRVPSGAQMSDYLSGICQKVKKSGGQVIAIMIELAHPKWENHDNELVDLLAGSASTLR
jgi:hypothetical protein